VSMSQSIFLLMPSIRSRRLSFFFWRKEVSKEPLLRSYPKEPLTWERRQLCVRGCESRASIESSSTLSIGRQRLVATLRQVKGMSIVASGPGIGVLVKRVDHL
jgi:hypothetical protein